MKNPSPQIRILVYLTLKVLAWEICNIELEFAKKVVIQSQITVTFYLWFEFLWIRRYIKWSILEDTWCYWCTLDKAFSESCKPKIHLCTAFVVFCAKEAEQTFATTKRGGCIKVAYDRSWQSPVQQPKHQHLIVVS